MATWAIAKKELRLLLRDRRAALILVAMPLLFILILGLLLGESFGQKADDRQRVSIVDLDEGPGLYPYSGVRQAGAWFAGTPGLNPLSSITLAQANHAGPFPHQSWSKVVQRDLAETAGIRLEIIDSLDAAEGLIGDHKRAAVLVFRPDFSREVTRCSFLVGGINPFHRDGVYLERVGAALIQDEKQPGEAAIVDQIGQVTLLRVLLPWMIGKAFERLSEPAFIELLGDNVRLPVPKGAELLFTLKNIRLEDGKASLNDALRVAAPNERTMADYREKVGSGVQDALKEQFRKYDLTGKTWAALTKAREVRTGEGAEVSSYVNKDGSGLLKRGAQRYQVLVPAYTVMFAFFLVMTMGWLFVSERRQGTLKRLRAAPLTRGQILMGKLLPCFVLSLGQEMFLLTAGKLVFGLRWGPEQWSLGHQLLWLLPVVFATSMAAMGLALLVSALARTEIQVALYGALPVLVLALIGGCILPREMMPEQAQQFSLITPHGWALNAYRELLDASPNALPNLKIVAQACAVLAGFGVAFFGLAWQFLKLE